MRDLEYLRKKAKKYNLVANYINKDQLKIYSPKYDFDYWIIEHKGNELNLLHRSKKNNSNKCTYHIQKTVKRNRKVDLLREIVDHNTYVAFYKRRNRVNLVDRVLKEPKRFILE